MTAVTLPFDPLDPYIETAGGVKAFSRAVAVERTLLTRWRERGALPTFHADTIAVRLGQHPAQLWGLQWFDTAELEPRCGVCNEYVAAHLVYCSKFCRTRANRERRRNRTWRTIQIGDELPAGEPKRYYDAHKNRWMLRWKVAKGSYVTLYLPA